MNDALRALYALQEVDTALALAQRESNRLDPGHQEASEVERCGREHTAAADRLQSATRDLAASELELRSVEQKKKGFEDKLYGGKVQNFKELESIQQEIEALGRQRSRLDERILLLMEEGDSARTLEATTGAALKAAEDALASRRAHYHAAAKRLAGVIREQSTLREQRVRGVPATLLARYDAIRAQRQGVGIAAIDGDLCGACHTRLPSDVIRSVHNTDAIELCDNCGRLVCEAAA